MYREIDKFYYTLSDSAIASIQTRASCINSVGVRRFVFKLRPFLALVAFFARRLVDGTGEKGRKNGNSLQWRIDHAF